MLKNIAKLIIVTFIPPLELRASIPAGVFHYQMKWPTVFAVCVVANIILGIAVFWALGHVVPFLTRIRPIGFLYGKYVERTQKRIDKAVDKWGEWAVAVFIGIPLPGSGVYSGALAAYLIGLKFRKFMVANVLGVLMAAVLVTTACVVGGETWELAKKVFFLKE
jgi:uncharacterized membrane protein